MRQRRFIAIFSTAAAAAVSITCGGGGGTAPNPNAACLAAGTTHPVTISTSETWTAAGSPHHITGGGTVTVTGGVLFIQDGAVVCLGDQASLTIQGGARLVAGSSGGATVTFRGEPAGNVAAGWDGIILHDQPPSFNPSILTNVLLLAPDQGIETDANHPVSLINSRIIRSNHHALRLLAPGTSVLSSTVDTTLDTDPATPAVTLGASGLVFQARVRHAQTIAVSVTAPNVAFSNCEITGSGTTGVAIQVGGGGTITSCNLTGNLGLAINNLSGVAMTADQVWFGSANPPGSGANGVSADVTVTNQRTSAVTLSY
jgi:hypothetical protein